MNHPTKIAALFAVAFLMQGCGSTSRMADLIGSTKLSPDETQIRTTQALSMPSDLSLPPPSAQVAEEDGQLVSTTARSPGTPPPDTAQQAYADDVSVASVAPQAPAAAPPAAADPAVDIYARYNISKTKADGSPKTQQELITELRAAQLAEKRRANPNYGTIFNVGDLFKDG